MPEQDVASKVNGSVTDKIIREKFNIRSELVHELISRKPGFLERWSMTIFLGITILVILGSWFIKYPDTINGHATLIAVNAPKELVTIQEGRIKKLFYKNGDSLSTNEIIAWLESTANHVEVIELSKRLDKCISLFDKLPPSEISQIMGSKFTQLGETQDAYKEFLLALQQFNDYTVNGFYAKKIQLLKDEVFSIEQMKKSTQAQKDLIEQDIQIAKESFDMQTTLEQEKVLSKEDFRNEKSKLLNKRVQVPQLDVSLNAYDNQQREKIKDIDQLTHDISTQKMVFFYALQTFKSNVDSWMKKYVIKSPIDGRIDFVIPLQENQFISSGKLLGYINPPDNSMYAQVNYSQNNFGKVKTGQKVQLRFDAYPYQEVGYVEGTLYYISRAPTDSGFLATVKLDKGLITNNKKIIQYKSKLSAQAITITSDIRLLERLYYSLVKSTSKD